MSSGEVLIPIIAIIGFFSAVITFVYMHYKSKHQQRMALIESGKTADIFFEKKLDGESSALKFGMLLTFAGLGFLLAVFIEEYTKVDEIILFPFTLVGGGLGLIMFYKTVINRRNYDD